MSVLHKVYGKLKMVPLYFLGKGKGLFVPAQYGIKPGYHWIEAGQETALPRETDIIICSDVIEHVPDPDSLLQLIGRIDFQLLFLSTPERDLVRGWYSYGPPENFCHIREWNMEEFRRYVSTHFEVIAQEITSVKDVTQLLICKRKPS